MTAEEKREQADAALFCVMCVDNASADRCSKNIQFCSSQGLAEKVAAELAEEHEGKEFGVFQLRATALLERKVRMKGIAG